MGIKLHQVFAELFGYHLVRKDKLVEIKLI